MNRSMRILPLLAVLSLGNLAPAAITFSFSAPSVTVAPGGTASIFATVTNSGPQTAFVDASTINISPGEDLIVDDFPFLLGAPIDGIDPGTSYTASMDILVGTTVPTGLYHIDYSLLGHFEDLTTFDVPASFEVNVQAVPEPATMLALAGGIGAFLRRRGRRA